MVRWYELQFHPDVSSCVNVAAYDSHMTAVSEF